MKELTKTNQKEKTNKGITLIALIITIIVLLILAGISIASLTGENGILSKANQAKEKTTEAEIKEKIGLLIGEYQLEKIEYPNLGLLEYFEQKKTKGEVDTVKDNQDGTIGVGLDGYTVTIDVETLTIIDIEISNDIEFSYELVSYQNSKFKILIKVEEKINGLQSIEYPDGNIQICNGEKLVEKEYDIDEGIDFIFIAKNTNGVEKKEVINFVKPKKPTIPNTSGYLTLTLTGANIPKIEISYDERKEFLNYYSLDNGETWDLYTGPISANTSVIKAKSVHKKCQDIFEETEQTVNSPVDAITWKSLDDNPETYDIYWSNNNYEAFKDGHYCLFNVDSSTWGQILSITYYLLDSNHGYKLGIRFYDENGNNFSNTTGPQTGGSYPRNDEFEIPEGTTKVMLYSAYYERGIWVQEIDIHEP